MPDRRTHRGAHPEDDRRFAPETLPRLRAAARDLAWLLTRGYAMRSALKLTGDRYTLDVRQRAAVMRSVCADDALARRQTTQAPPDDLVGASLLVDGFNVITTVEAALGGAVILEGRDRCYRDLAGVHGSYRKVDETLPSIRLVGESIESRGVAQCTWLLDSPVSNSGRLKVLLLESALRWGWDWRVDLMFSPDAALREYDGPVATADGAILDRCKKWVNLARETIDARVQGARVIDLFDEGGEMRGE